MQNIQTPIACLHQWRVLYHCVDVLFQQADAHGRDQLFPVRTAFEERAADSLCHRLAPPGFLKFAAFSVA